MSLNSADPTFLTSQILGLQVWPSCRLKGFFNFYYSLLFWPKISWYSQGWLQNRLHASICVLRLKPSERIINRLNPQCSPLLVHWPAWVINALCTLLKAGKANTVTCNRNILYRVPAVGTVVHTWEMVENLLSEIVQGHASCYACSIQWIG